MAAAELRGRVMASDVHLVAVDPAPGQLDDALATLRHLEQLWSRFLPASDISRVNQRAGRAVAVDPLTVTLVAAMIEAWRATSGQFDPSVLPSLVVNGYAVSRTNPKRRTVLTNGPFRLGGFGEVELDATAGTVTVPHGIAIDPGGIGKGLAADLVATRLLAGGARGALAGIGGDLAMAGTPPHPDGWFVAVERPDPADGLLCTLAVSGGGVATSSTQSRRWVHDGRDQHHQIDPRTGEPTTSDLASVTVIAPTGWEAEAFATAAVAAGSRRVLDVFEEHDLSGIAITTKGSILLTHDLDAIDLHVNAGRA